MKPLFYDAVLAIVAGLINMHASFLGAAILKKSGLLKRKSQILYGATETWLRVYTMAVAIILFRWLITKILWEIDKLHPKLEKLKRPELKSTLIGSIAFASPLAGDVASYFT
jgi:hypothetical protein